MKNIVRECWYMAAWSHEVGEKPLGRRILDIPVALFRNEAGIAAVLDRCPHRFARLSKGRVIDDKIECPYHGLRFDGEGKCREVPISTGKFVPTISVTTFPVREIDGFVWIWMGDVDQADSVPPPDLGFLRPSEHVELLRMYMRQESNFFLGIDNLMDPSHTAFAHRQTLSQGTDFFYNLFARARYACIRMEGGRINSQWSFVDEAGEHDPDEKFEAIWIPPNIILQRSRSSYLGLKPNHDSYSNYLHVLTPETDHSAHYFAVDAYDRRERSEEALRQQEQFLKEMVFTAEDDPILADIDRAMDGADLFAMKPVILPADAAAVMVRKEYKKLLRGAQVASGSDAL
jgi:phenylpropionate dioxygenase-like ring-hydroxylating dioxygenase large terminal subunit